MNWKFCVATLAALGLNSFGQAGLIVRGGLNLANVAIDPSPPSGVDVASRTGINLALLGDFPLNGAVHALVGAGFENKGATSSAFGEEDAAQLNYLVVPILLSLGTPPSPGPNGPGPRVFINAGLEPAILLSANEETTFNGATQNTDESNNTSGFDLSLCGELGAEIPFSPTMAGILGAGYSFGVTNWNATDGSTETDHNYVIKFFAGVRFGFRGAGIAPPPAR